MSDYDPKRTSETVLRFNLNLSPTACFTLVVSGVRGCKLPASVLALARAAAANSNLKANVATPGTGSGTFFFACKDWDHIHIVDETRLETDAAR